jgi:hypothetical protein
MKKLKGTRPFILAKGCVPFTNMKGRVPFVKVTVPLV